MSIDLPITAESFITSVEGIVLKPYDIEGDISGVDTIGVGHVMTDQERTTGYIQIGKERVSWLGGITKAQSLRLLSQDLIPVKKCVRSNVFVPLSGNQRIALESFVFNCGCGAFRRSTLLKLLNAGEYEQVPDQLRRYVYNGKNADGTPHKVKGLVNRREKEVKIWETP